MSHVIGEVPWVFDRFGFPYLPVPGRSFAVSLLPVTRAQAELWLGDPHGPGDDWYAEVLAASPRGSWRTPGRVPVPQLLFTGLLPADASRFAAWYGPEYRPPTATEWRAGDSALSVLPPEELSWLVASVESGNGHPAAAGLVRKLAETGRRTARELCLLRGGVLEWLTMPTAKPGALGRPAAELAGNLILDPQAFDPVSPIRLAREPLFGMRLIREAR